MTGRSEVVNPQSATAFTTSSNVSTEQNVCPWVTMGRSRLPFQQSICHRKQANSRCQANFDSNSLGDFDKSTTAWWRSELHLNMPATLQQLTPIHVGRAEARELVAHDNPNLSDDDPNSAHWIQRV
eukprot:7109850-Prymnesium_polylepis.2